MKKLTAKAEICLEDLDHSCRPREAIDFVFDLIGKCKAAVFAKSGEVRSFKYDSRPTIENPCGDIATITFEIAVPYDCVQGNLEVMSAVLPQQFPGDRLRCAPLVNFLVIFDHGPKGATGAMGPGPCPTGMPSPTGKTS